MCLVELNAFGPVSECEVLFSAYFSMRRVYTLLVHIVTSTCIFNVYSIGYTMSYICNLYVMSSLRLRQ